MKTKLNKIITPSIKNTLFAILLGILFGSVMLFITGFNPIEFFTIIIKGVIGRPKYIAYTLIKATPLILTGLSITFAFKTGLFNIGAEGQFIIGALVAGLLGYFLKLPIIIHVPIIIICASIAGGLWGAIAGILKAKFKINEVISTIMLNWIALYLSNYVVSLEGYAKPNMGVSHEIQETASIKILHGYKLTEEGKLFFSDKPILSEIFDAPINIGFIIAILAAFIVLLILNKTTLGYRLKAVGINKDAAEFGGINVEKSMVISMFIAGGLAGLGGTLQVLGVTQNVSTLLASSGYGFQGIAVALIGNTTPIGTIFAAIFFSALTYGGAKVQAIARTPSEIVNIIVGIIILFLAIPKLYEKIKNYIDNKRGWKI